MIAHYLRLFTITTTLVIVGMTGQNQAQSEKQETLDSLIRAIQEGDSRTVHSMLAKGVELNARGSNGTTALIESIEAYHPELAEELVTAGADSNFPDYTDASPLMHAAWNCQLELARFLLERKARLGARNRDGETALMMGAWTCKDGRMVRLLLEAGAAVNDKSKSGNTPLMMAVSNGDEAAVRVLVAAGADLKAVNDEGETALTLARSYGIGKKKLHKRIYAYLNNVSKQTSKGH